METRRNVPPDSQQTPETLFPSDCELSPGLISELNPNKKKSYEAKSSPNYRSWDEQAAVYFNLKFWSILLCRKN